MSEGIFYTLGLRTAGFTGPLGAAQSAVGRFGSSVAGMAGKIAVLAAPVIGLGAAFAGFRKAITAAADMESTTVAFETLIGSAEKAKKTLDELKALGASTPFEFPELADAGRKLIAFGEGAETVSSTLRRIGDLASGVQAPIGEIAELFGKARVQGTLFAEDIDQLTGRGIPVIQQFARILGVSQGEVKKLASEGKITFPLLEQAFVNLTSQGGQFFGMMAKQSATTNGLLSTLRDNIGEIFRIIGQPINDFLRPFLEDGIVKVQRLGQGLAAFIKLLNAAREGGQLGEFLGTSLVLAAKETVNVLSSGFRGAAAFLGTALRGSMDAAVSSTFGERFGIAIMSIFRAASDLIAAGARVAASEVAALLGRTGLSDQLRELAQLDFAAADRNLGIAQAATSSAGSGEAAAFARRMVEAGKKAGEAAAAAMEDAAPIFDTTSDKRRFADLSRGLDPKAFAELTKAFQDTPYIVKKLTKEQEFATTAVKNFTAAMKPATTAANNAASKNSSAGDEPKERRQIFAKGAAESNAARLNRMSQVDKDRAARFGKPGFNRNFPVEGVNIGEIQARGAEAMRNARPTKQAPPKDQAMRDAASRAEQLLTKIESHLAKVEAA